MNDKPHDMLTCTVQPSRRPDPLLILLSALAAIGLICIVVAIWAVYSRANAPVTDLYGAQMRRSELIASLATVGAQSTACAAAAQTRQVEQTQELERLHAGLAELGAREAALQATVSAATVLEKPPLALVLDVPVFKQTHNLSCEACAAAMAAHFFGVPVGEAEILAALPRDLNPHKGFRGNIDGLHGGLDDYGVYAEPIARVLGDLGIPTRPLTGGVSEIRAHLRHGRPVMVWVTYELSVQVPQQVTLADGETVTLVPYEHALLIVGYNADGFWVNDPYTGMSRFYPEGELMRSWGYLDYMALVVGP